MALRSAGGNKRTRFACLETLRCMVATAVSVLTFVVVVMVTHAALRPVDSYTLSFVNGMYSFTPWSSNLNSSDAKTTQQQVAKRVNLRFALQAYNPSGRKDIHIDGFDFHVFEIPDYPSLYGMKYIAAFPVPAPEFNVRKQSVHKLWSNFTLTDAAKLSHIANTYGALGTFKAMVLVYPILVVGYGTPERHPVRAPFDYYACWPVLVGWYEDIDSPRGGVTCTRREELSIGLDSLLSWSADAPAPAPAPIGG